MNYRWIYLPAVALVCAAAPSVAISASSAGHPGRDVDIVVNGVPQPRYAHSGRWYVEALKGREYAIRLRNPYPVRVAVALSVDGLNTIDARETTATDARKWVLGPYETVTISGWQTSRTEARRFEFTTEARSYGQALGKTENLGMISAVFFRERVGTVLPDASNEEKRRRRSGSSTRRGSRTGGRCGREPEQGRRRIRGDRHGAPHGSRRDPGLDGSGRRTRADREHPL